MSHQWDKFQSIKKCDFYVNYGILLGHIVFLDGLLVD